MTCGLYSFAERASTAACTSTSAGYFRVSTSDTGRTSKPGTLPTMSGSSTSSEESSTERRSRSPVRASISRKKAKRMDTSPASKRFCDYWLQDTAFNGWLAKVKANVHQAICKCCNKTLMAGKSDLLKHMKTKKHKQAWATFQKAQPIPIYQESVITASRSVASAEMREALGVVEHNWSFNSFDHTIERQQVAYPDSAIARSCRMKRDKVASIIENVLANVVDSEMSETLKRGLFSVFIDESTDNSARKNICVIVRYVCPTTGKIMEQLLDYKEVTDATAEGLFKLFSSMLTKRGIPFANIVGYASDNASVMMGVKDSFKTRLEKKVRELVVIPCICHSAHLVASHAAELLPKSAEGLLHMLYSYYSKSPKRQGNLNKLQETFGEARGKLLNPAKTRWLSLLSCITRVLDLWDVLLADFRATCVEEPAYVAEKILKIMNDVYIKAYLHFLQYTLTSFNKFNAFFQSDKPQVTKLASESARFIRQLCGNFMRPDLVQGPVSGLKPNDPKSLLPLKDVRLGSRCEKMLDSLPADKNDEFRATCLRFYQRAAVEAIKRFPASDSFLAELEAFDPLKLFQLPRPRIGRLLERFGERVNVQEVEQEWDQLPTFFTIEEQRAFVSSCSTVEDAYKKLNALKDCSGDPAFGALCSLLRIILLLPHSNANVERVFSICADIVTKKRNRLMDLRVAALLRVRLNLITSGFTCVNFPFRDAHFKAYDNHTKSSGGVVRVTGNR
jgi:hypothetical protein